MELLIKLMILERILGWSLAVVGIIFIVSMCVYEMQKGKRK